MRSIQSRRNRFGRIVVNSLVAEVASISKLGITYLSIPQKSDKEDLIFRSGHITKLKILQKLKPDLTLGTDFKISWELRVKCILVLQTSVQNAFQFKQREKRTSVWKSTQFPSRNEYQFTHRVYENWFKVFNLLAIVLNLAWMIRHSRRRKAIQFFLFQHAALHRIRSVDTTSSQPLFYLEDLNGKRDENAYYKEES